MGGHPKQGSKGDLHRCPHCTCSSSKGLTRKAGSQQVALRDVFRINLVAVLTYTPPLRGYK